MHWLISTLVLLAWFGVPSYMAHRAMRPAERRGRVMSTPDDEAIAALEAAWPDWQIWVIRPLVGGPVWCARLRDAGLPIRALHASRPAELAELIEQAEAVGS